MQGSLTKDKTKEIPRNTFPIVLTKRMHQRPTSTENSPQHRIDNDLSEWRWHVCVYAHHLHSRHALYLSNKSFYVHSLVELQVNKDVIRDRVSVVI